MLQSFYYFSAFLLLSGCLRATQANNSIITQRGLPVWSLTNWPITLQEAGVESLLAVFYVWFMWLHDMYFLSVCLEKPCAHSGLSYITSKSTPVSKKIYSYTSNLIIKKEQISFEKNLIKFFINMSWWNVAYESMLAF